MAIRTETLMSVELVHQHRATDVSAVADGAAESGTESGRGCWTCTSDAEYVCRSAQQRCRQTAPGIISYAAYTAAVCFFSKVALTLLVGRQEGHPA